MQCEYRGFELDCVWYPAQTMCSQNLRSFVSEIDKVNAAGKQRLAYGFFARDAHPRWRYNFLRRTAWCLIRREGVACGFVYNVDLGDVDGRRVVHAGLIRFSRHLGAEMFVAAYLPLTLGNLLNFGPHALSSITHMPLIAELFGCFARDTFPVCSVLPQTQYNYQAVLHRLRDAYILPVLRYPRDAVGEHNYRITNTLADSKDGFETRWSRIGRFCGPDSKAFFEQSLNFRQDNLGELHICDDLIQIGKIGHCFPHNSRVADQLQRLRLRRVLGKPSEAGRARVPRSLGSQNQAVFERFLGRDN